MRPAECALVVAAPLSREEFAADLDRGSDFLTLFSRQHPRLTRDGLADVYEQSAGSVRRAIDRCRHLGASVFTRATLADFRGAIERFEAVTLVAHWRSALFRPSDIVDPDAVRTALTRLNGAVEDANPPPPLVERLNRLLEPEPLVDRAGEEDSARSAALEAERQQRLYCRRRRLDASLGEAVAGGAGVEFADGMAALGAVVAAVPAGFAGTLDLTVCNSTLLAEEVRKRCSGGLILSNAFPARLDVRLLFYRATLELMARRPLSYVDAMLAVRRKLRG